jgi:signal transduction histidine kinase/ligand-binding sensor domain-containing protein/ActR/RegA family two-component response regulator
MKTKISGGSLIFFIAGIAFSLITNVLSQEQGIKFTTYNTNDGLSQSSVVTIFQDDEGFLWFGSYAGLNRFDGNNFIIYDHSLTDSNSISESHVRSICQDTTGILFIATMNGLNRFFTYTNEFVHFFNDSTDPNSLSSNTIFKIFKDHEGDIWIGTWGGGLDKLERIDGVYRDEKEVRYKFIHHKPVDGQNSISSLFVTDIAEGHDGTIWIATNNGLNCYNKKTKKFVCYKHDPDNPNSLTSSDVSSVCIDHKGFVWAGTWGGGLNIIDPQTNEIASFRHNPNNINSLSYDIVMELFCDDAGDIWAGTFGGGLNRIVLDSIRYFKIPFLRNKVYFIDYKHIDNDFTSISANSIYSIFQDRTGVMWLGTDWGGVNKFERGSAKFKHIFSDRADKNTLVNNIVFSLFVDSKNLLWIGTQGGLNIYNKKTNKFELFTNDLLDPNSLSDNNIRSIAEDQYGHIWIGTVFGLNKYIEGTRKFKRYFYDPLNQNLDLIQCVRPTSNGKIWIGTYYAGLQMFDPKTEKFTNYLKDDKNPLGIEDNVVGNIIEDKQGLLWIGTRNSGLVVYNPATNKSISYSNNPTDNFSISNNYVLSMFIDHADNLWVGTSFGLNKRIIDNNGKISFKRYYQKDGLPSNGIHGIIEDNFNQIWITTLKGICRLNPETDEVANYKKEDGLQDLEFSLNSVTLDKNTGELYAGGINGFNIFNPRDLPGNTMPPTVKIVDLRIFNKSIGVGTEVNGKVILDKQISATNSINLTYIENVITFEFAALHFQSPKGNKFAFKLDGFEKDWNYVSNQRTATYTNLAPGTYRFNVKAANTYNNWSEKPVELIIYIKPPWWNTILFKILAVLIVGSVVWFVFWLRIKILTSQKKILEEMVSERTGELHETNVLLEEKQEEISTQNEELIQHRFYLEKLVDERTVELKEAKVKAEESDKLKSAFLANMSHEVRTPMNAIIGFSNLLEDRSIDEEEKDFLIKTIRNNGDTLLTLINDIIDISMIEADQLVLYKNLFCIDDILLEIHSYYSMNNNKPIEIQIVSPDSNSKTFIFNDIVRFRQVLNNLISNAIKYTDTGTIKFGYKIIDELIEVFVEDTGVGIDKNDKERIFDYFYKIETDIAKIYRGTGIGLSICKNLVGLMGGTLKVESEVGKGSRFYFSLQKSMEPLSGNLSFEQESSKETILKDINIVVAEDEPNNYELIKRSIQKTGANIFWAHNGKEAIELVKEKSNEKKCIVLMDIKMPVMDGIEANQHIKKINKDIPVIALTAYAQVGDRTRIMQQNFDDYMSKPINPKKLLELVKFFSAKISR